MRERMIWLIALLALVSGQDPWKKGNSGYTWSDEEQSEASNDCSEGYNLCTVAQLYQLAYSSSNNYSKPDICYSGWMADTDSQYNRGWFNNDENSLTNCGVGNGFNDWVHPNGWGAHCCIDDPDFLGVEPAPCTDFDCGAVTGDLTYMESDSYYIDFCVDGVCDESQCCQEYVEAPLYQTYPGKWGYDYASGEEAQAACEALEYGGDNPYTLCTQQQVSGVNAYGVDTCSSGWWRTQDGYGRGFYANDVQVNAGECGSTPGFQAWVQPDGTGTAHCCIPSYKEGEYKDLEPGNGYEDAINWCSNLLYHTDLCTMNQLIQVAQIEAQNICKSGWVTSEMGIYGGEIGWEQTQTEDEEGNPVCNGISGWRKWASATPAAHCCLPYVLEYEPAELTWEYSPQFYSQSSFTDAAAAENYCVNELGYDQLCTVEQVAWIGSNSEEDGGMDNLCTVGWVSNKDDAGFYNTAGNCGDSNTWFTSWNVNNPVAFCCQSTVEEVSVVQPPYYNGGWGTYIYTDADSAAEECSEGYDLCTWEQLYTVAYEGVTWDGVDWPAETNICFDGWTKDNGAGWWQNEDACNGITGWQRLNQEVASWHCCTAFEATSLGTTTTLAPTYPVYQVVGYYQFFSEQEALEACQDEYSEYVLCSAAQLIDVALNDQFADDSGNWEDVEAQTSICKSGWLSTEGEPICSEHEPYGWYQVDAANCSPAFKFNRWAPKTPGDAEPYAAAHCCAPFIEPAKVYDAELGCEQTTASPTTTEDLVLYEAVSSEVASALTTLADIDTSSLYTYDNQYYIYSGGEMTATCVGYGDADTTCSYTNGYLCAGALGITFGDYAYQGELLKEAMDNSNVHAFCPPDVCAEVVDLYFYQPIADSVSYCLSSDNCYYWNGMATCVCTDSDDINADLQAAFEDEFYLSLCDDSEKRTYDQVLRDQLYITNALIDDLEEQIEDQPDLDAQLAEAEEQISTIWTNYEVEITLLIQNAQTALDNGAEETYSSDDLGSLLATLTAYSDRR